jgi:hypothetical protein
LLLARHLPFILSHLAQYRNRLQAHPTRQQEAESRSTTRDSRARRRQGEEGSHVEQAGVGHQAGAGKAGESYDSAVEGVEGKVEEGRAAKYERASAFNYSQSLLRWEREKRVD